jgi:hypothetical protein
VNFEKIIMKDGVSLDKDTMEELVDLCRRKSIEKTSIYVLYNTNCGCNYQKTVLLDRHPMSKGIHTRCNECEKYDLIKITDPVRFYIPIIDKEFGLVDLQELVFTEETRQKFFIDQYIDEFKNERI